MNCPRCKSIALYLDSDRAPACWHCGWRDYGEPPPPPGGRSAYDRLEGVKPQKQNGLAVSRRRKK